MGWPVFEFPWQQLTLDYGGHLLFCKFHPAVILEYIANTHTWLDSFACYAMLVHYLGSMGGEITSEIKRTVGNCPTGKLWTCSFCCFSYYWGYCHYCDYFAGKCTAWDIGIERLSSAQGPLRTIQLFGAWPHQVQWCAAGLLQPVPCEPTLRQPLIGPRYDSASRYWKWCFRGHARFSLVRTGFAPFLCLSTNGHRVQTVWLCSRVDAGNIWRFWEW